MSRTMSLGCHTCKESIWIGQNNAFYSGMPEVMEGLRLFLIKHRTEQLEHGRELEHNLRYEPSEEFYGDEWVEVDTDQYKRIRSEG